MDDQDRRRKRGLIAFQIFIYGALLAMFLIQVGQHTARDNWGIQPKPRYVRIGFWELAKIHEERLAHESSR